VICLSKIVSFKRWSSRKLPSNYINSSRLTSYQVILLAIAIIGAGILLLYFPEPKPLVSIPLPDNLIEINVTTVRASRNDVSAFPASRVNVSIYSLSADGRISKYDLQARTDTKGIAQTKLYDGKYIVKVADWTPQEVTVNGDAVLYIRKFEVEDVPTIRIAISSKDWIIAPNDLMEISYSNSSKKPILLNAVMF